MTTTAPATLTAGQKLDGSGSVHAVRFGRAGATTFCTGRTMRWIVGTDAPVSCTSCIKRAARNAHGPLRAGPMSARTCSDGSSCVVTDYGVRHVTISRYVDGVLVWGQNFAGSPETHDALVARVVAEMVEHPENYDRRNLWDENGRAVAP